jgi:hypothetical protein
MDGVADGTDGRRQLVQARSGVRAVAREGRLLDAGAGGGPVIPTTQRWAIFLAGQYAG